MPDTEESPPPIQPSRAARRPRMLRQRREERYQAAERQRRQQRLTRIGLAAAALLLAVGLGYLVLTTAQRNQVPEGTREFAMAAGHAAETVAYDPTPPVGGEHDPTPQTCGFYSVPVRNENAVHSLEHGAVWITYRPDLPPDQIDRLRALARSEGKVLVSPYDDLPSPVVASSWGRQLQLDSAGDARLGQFVQRFRGAAPEPNALCAGVGTPE
ncbi:MAG: DUF3105 domain-containing protein [Thermomicrobiales bacterium]|nr:DUF3105 domain-containing protein [Thermomicrobiales bacterium]